MIPQMQVAAMMTPDKTAERTLMSVNFVACKVLSSDEVSFVDVPQLQGQAYADLVLTSNAQTGAHVITLTKRESSQVLLQIPLPSTGASAVRVGQTNCILSTFAEDQSSSSTTSSYNMKFASAKDCHVFHNLVQAVQRGGTGEDVTGASSAAQTNGDSSNTANKKKRASGDDTSGKKGSVFDEKTDPSSATGYFDYYAKLIHQQNMLQDTVRTSTYHSAVFDNKSDFEGKVVMDVGCGSGILSFFAVLAGAKKVYAVEASGMAHQARKLAESNGWGDRMKIVHSKVEEITDEQVPEKVDMIISEPMGTLLINERMLESYLYARIRFLKPGGRMFPTTGDIYIAPFSDDVLYTEGLSQTAFWSQTDFYGVNFSSLYQTSLDQYFGRPVVDYWVPQILMAPPVVYHIDFMTFKPEDLNSIRIPFSFTANRVGVCHGLGSWFNVTFIGSSASVVLSTAPGEPLTHWQQMRLLTKNPLGVNIGQRISGSLVCNANDQQSYIVNMTICLDTVGLVCHNQLDVKNPVYRTSQFTPPMAPVTAAAQGAHDPTAAANGAVYNGTTWGTQGAFGTVQDTNAAPTAMDQSTVPMSF
eukprot:GFYU01012828.1.p1 GENE.GFYU01012828.1~~GFYU01012828.1.p1  ORF type:complete len:586 (-),score=121.61 GFYU01012828.1:249-2006(-)